MNPSAKEYLIAIIISILSATVAAPVVCADDPRARAIMEKVDARDDGNNQVSDMKMILIDKRGNKRIRKIQSFSKDKGEDTIRLMFFLHPAEVKDVAFLTYGHQGNRV